MIMKGSPAESAGAPLSIVRKNLQTRMTTQILFLIIAGLIVAAGLIGLVLPAFPGAILIFLGFLLAAWAEGFIHVGFGTLSALGVMALLIYAVDFIAGALGAKRFGASTRAIVGRLDRCGCGPFFRHSGRASGTVYRGRIGGVVRPAESDCGRKSRHRYNDWPGTGGRRQTGGRPVHDRTFPGDSVHVGAWPGAGVDETPLGPPAPLQRCKARRGTLPRLAICCPSRNPQIGHLGLGPVYRTDNRDILFRSGCRYAFFCASTALPGGIAITMMLLFFCSRRAVAIFQMRLQLIMFH